MSTTYDGPLGLSVTVRPRDSNVTVGFNRRIALVAPMDTGGGSASVGSAEQITDETDATNKFGSGSEMHASYLAARDNGATDIYGVGIDDTNNDYTGAVASAVGVNPRYIYVGTTDTQYISDAVNEVESRADDLDFTRVWAPIHTGAVPDLQNHSGSDLSGFSPAAESMRLVQVAPTETDHETETAYAAAAVASHAVRKPLGQSITFDDIEADGLTPEYRPTNVSSVSQLTVITQDGEVVDGLTTSGESALTDVFQTEIIDLVINGVAEIIKQYKGESVNTPEQRQALASDVRSYCQSLTTRRPPLLSSASGGPAYSVQEPSVGGADDMVEMTFSISPVDVMKEIDITMDVSSTISVESIDA